MMKGKPAMLSGAHRKDVTAFAFGAHFVEVRVHSRTREIRVARVVSAFSAGTIINPLTAHSQFMGGAIWGLSSALFEQTEIDRRAGGTQAARAIRPTDIADRPLPPLKVLSIHSCVVQRRRSAHHRGL